MNRTIKECKDLEQLSYYLYHKEPFYIPRGWESVDKFSNSQNGFEAEAFRNNKGEIFIIYKGTDTDKWTEAKKDLTADFELAKNQLPSQSLDALHTYYTLSDKYGKENVKISGYSLGASLGVIIGNETGAETIVFEPYGVGKIVEPQYTEQITCFGHEKDPIFLKELDSQLGSVYIIPKDETDVEKFYSEDSTWVNPIDLQYHFPNKIGDLENAVKYGGSNMLKGYIRHEDFDDSIFDYKNRVYYKSELLPLDEFEKEDIDVFWDQALSKEGLPTKEELDARSRMGELIYVESYVRSNGTKVSGYYRKCPR